MEPRTQQFTQKVDILPHSVYDGIDTATMQVVKDVEIYLYLFPDQPETFHMYQALKSGPLQNLHF
ncbi:MAG TPA: hypothetical protein PKE64_08620 [Anaerolineae bacterium]|nr:hypothetical protein [Anaerolineae bacterium]HMR64058.1 hypothetical protein [Anaerolineae bacterium]